MENSISEMTIPSFSHQPQHSSTPIKKVEQHETYTSFSPHSQQLMPPPVGPVTKISGDKRGYQMAAPPQHRAPGDNSLANVSFPQNLSSLLGEETIQKQRHELQMLMGELRDRDRELNGMVATHQQQLAAWEADRHRILRLEQKAAKLQGLLDRKTHEAAMLQTRLGVLESEQGHKMAALENTQQQLVHMSEQQSYAALHLKEMEEKNKDLNDSVKGMISAVEHFEAKEHQLEEVIKAKDSDLLNGSHQMEEMTQQVQQLDAQCCQLQEAKEEAARREEEWRGRCQEKGTELEKVQEQLSTSQLELDEQRLEVEKYQQKVAALTAQLHMAGERERRKDEVIELQHSKQERLDSELESLRQLYERQQRDLSLLHLNLETSKEMLDKHAAIYSDTSSTYSASPVKSQTSVSSQSSPSKATSLQIISPIQKHYSPIQKHYSPRNVEGQTEHQSTCSGAGSTSEDFLPMQPDDVDDNSPTCTKQDTQLKSRTDFTEPPLAKSKNAQNMHPSSPSKRSVKTRQPTPKKVNQRVRTVEALATEGSNVKGARHKSAPFVNVGETKKQHKQLGIKSDLLYNRKQTIAPTTTVGPSRELIEKHEPKAGSGGKGASGKHSHRSPQTAVQMYAGNGQDDSLSELTQNMGKAGQKPIVTNASATEPVETKVTSANGHVRHEIEGDENQVYQNGNNVRYAQEGPSSRNLTDSVRHVPKAPSRWHAGQNQYHNVQSCPELPPGDEYQNQYQTSQNRHSSLPETIQENAFKSKPNLSSSNMKGFTDSACSVDMYNHDSSVKFPVAHAETKAKSHTGTAAVNNEFVGCVEGSRSHEYTEHKKVTTNSSQWTTMEERSTTPLTQQHEQPNTQVEPSPLGKLEQLLAESRQMVAQLEQSSTQPYFTSHDKSPKSATPR